MGALYVRRGMPRLGRNGDRKQASASAIADASRAPDFTTLSDVVRFAAGNPPWAVRCLIRGH